MSTNGITIEQVAELFGGADKLRDELLDRMADKALHSTSVDEYGTGHQVPTHIKNRINEYVDKTIKATLGPVIDAASREAIDAEYEITGRYGAPGETTTLRKEIAKTLAELQRDRYHSSHQMLKEEAKRAASEFVKAEVGDALAGLSAALAGQLKADFLSAVASASSDAARKARVS